MSGSPAADSAAEARGLTAAGALAAARRIGTELCRTAFWDDERRRCNWLGRADRQGDVPGSVVPATAALEADLYRGSSGVALFLAELAAVSGDEEAAATAVAALRRSLAYLRQQPLERASPLSLFSGHLGVAFAGARICRLLPAAGELEAAIAALRPAIAGAFDEPHPRDYLGGNAGAIAALLRLAHSTGDDAWLALARRAAEELAASARRDGAAATWDAAELAGPFGEAPPESATPTGLSHGAGGVALGLFELYAATGDQGLLDLARGALAYEDRFFDRDAGNWRDVRSTAETPSFSTAWCHGAPGIALVRLRAMAVDRERREHHAEQARTALATTAAAVERALAAPRHDATLCHGSCGLAEVLAIGDRLLGETRYAATVGRAAATLVARYGERGDWPSGIPSAGPTPALWLGSAGIGHHLLRLHRPQVPPILLLG